MVNSDSESSYGDDESDHDSGFIPAFQAFDAFGLGQEGLREDEDMDGLPQAFAGHEIEDLAYGGGKPEFEMERQVLSGLWEDDEDEDEEVSLALREFAGRVLIVAVHLPIIWLRSGTTIRIVDTRVRLGRFQLRMLVHIR